MYQILLKSRPQKYKDEMKTIDEKQQTETNKHNLPMPNTTMEWTNCRKLLKNSTYETNPKLYATMMYHE